MCFCLSARLDAGFDFSINYYILVFVNRMLMPWLVYRPEVPFPVHHLNILPTPVTGVGNIYHTGWYTKLCLLYICFALGIPFNPLHTVCKWVHGHSLLYRVQVIYWRVNIRNRQIQLHLLEWSQQFWPAVLLVYYNINLLLCIWKCM